VCERFFFAHLHLHLHPHHPPFHYRVSSHWSTMSNDNGDVGRPIVRVNDISIRPSDSGPHYDFCIFTDFDPDSSMEYYDRGLIVDPQLEIRAYPSTVMWFTLVEGPNRGVHLCSGKRILELGGVPTFPMPENPFPNCRGFYTSEEASAYLCFAMSHHHHLRPLYPLGPGQAPENSCAQMALGLVTPNTLPGMDSPLVADKDSVSVLPTSPPMSPQSSPPMSPQSSPLLSMPSLSPTPPPPPPSPLPLSSPPVHPATLQGMHVLYQKKFEQIEKYWALLAHELFEARLISRLYTQGVVGDEGYDSGESS